MTSLIRLAVQAMRSGSHEEMAALRGLLYRATLYEYRRIGRKMTRFRMLFILCFANRMAMCGPGHFTGVSAVYATADGRPSLRKMGCHPTIFQSSLEMNPGTFLPARPVGLASSGM